GGCGDSLCRFDAHGRNYVCTPLPHSGASLSPGGGLHGMGMRSLGSYAGFGRRRSRSRLRSFSPPAGGSRHSGITFRVATMSSPSVLQHGQPTSTLSLLVCAYVALLPYRFDVGNNMNFAPADCFLGLILVLALGQLRYRKQAWTGWHFGIGLVFAAGS